MVFSVSLLVSLHTFLLHARTQGALAPAGRIVESVRQIGEMLVYGDKGMPGEEGGESFASPGGSERYLEAFCEHGMLRTFVWLYQDAHVLNCWGGVAVQVLQTMSILLLNAARSSTLFYLLSNSHLNDLIESAFDQGDEELMGYYVSLLTTLSLAFGTGAADTLQFFFITPPSPDPGLLG